jgi:hypothetical protein
MSTNRQKSFIATLELDEHHVDFLGSLYGIPALRHDTLFSGGFFIGATRRHDDSHLLGSRPRCEVKNIAPLSIYFRCTDDYYHLYIRSHGTYTGRCISKDAAGVLGAFPAAGSDTTTFNLQSLQNRTMTLENMAKDIQRVRLKARNSGHIGAVFRSGAPYSYLAGIEEEGVVFKLRILERNAPYLSNPDEI